MSTSSPLYMCVAETQTLWTLQDKSQTVSNFGVCANVMMSVDVLQSTLCVGKFVPFLSSYSVALVLTGLTI